MASPKLGGLFGPGFMQGLQDNSGMMMALGGQLLAHRQNATLPMFDPAMAVQASTLDQKRVSEREEKEEKKRIQTATFNFVKGRLPDMPDDQIMGVVGNPTILNHMLKGDEIINAGDGRLYNQTKNEWITAPGSDAPDMEEAFKLSQGLRKEVTSGDQFKRYGEALPVYESMIETLPRNDKYSDLNLVYGLAKIMDPTSVVREGEQVLVQNAAGLPQWLIGQINAVSGGAGLTPESRRKLVKEAESRVKSYRKGVDQEQQFYGGVADSYQLPRDQVLPQLGDLPTIPLSAGGRIVRHPDGTEEWMP